MFADHFNAGTRQSTHARSGWTSRIDLGDRSAEGIEALSRHQRILADAERQHLCDLAAPTRLARVTWASFGQAIDRRLAAVRSPRKALRDS